jgi:hypothetical protein
MAKQSQMNRSGFNPSVRKACPSVQIAVLGRMAELTHLNRSLVILHVEK